MKLYFVLHDPFPPLEVVSQGAGISMGLLPLVPPWESLVLLEQESNIEIIQCWCLRRPRRSVDHSMRRSFLITCDHSNVGGR